MEKEFLNISIATCEMQYTKDCLGQEMLLKDGKFQVMMEWEKPYMQACIDALQPFGDVLEVGFGCGYSASHIQTYHPKSHTIIEYHPLIAREARQWAKAYPHVTIIEDTWQHALSQLGVYDCIFFDDYPLESEEQPQKMQQLSQDSSSLLKQGSEMLSQVEKELPFLNSIQYSKKDLCSLIDTLVLEKDTGVYLYRFFSELKQREQISAELFNEMVEELIERQWLDRGNVHILSEEKSGSLRGPNERLMQFLSQCLSHHMRKHSRFSCFLSDPATTWENNNFFNDIIANPYLDYREKEIPIEAPAHCSYYKSDKALVIVVEKML